MESMLPWVIQLVSGAVGGVGAGSAMKNQSHGTVGNAISGVVGGGLGGMVLQYIIPAITGAVSSGGMTAGNIGADITGGGIGEAIVMNIVGLIKQKMEKKRLRNPAG